MTKKLSGNEIRQTFIDFFVEHGHAFVPSASLIPGGDSTLLFTNAGMVQFKDVFLGTDKRPYTRAVDSQKCLRVAGKHNDLEEVGRDGSHHTFFEMLGNWSFGDYYKKEAITWAWQLLTDVWGLPKADLYVTCFKDDKGNIPQDDEAAQAWGQQPGFDPSHVLFFGRKENFWEMAETGPCGPCSEIHIDRGVEYCDKQDMPGHVCRVNGDCERFLELWNNVFIQYNRLDADRLEPLPAKHVDTGMGFERIVSVLQGVDSNYKIDLFKGALDVVRSLTGEGEQQMYAHFTPYRVIADHARAAAFLIADGVVPGNTGRNYICRMIIRRAARFGTKIDLHEPFLARVAEAIIASYGDFYPELVKSRQAIVDNLTREEVRFARTVESGTAFLQGMLDELKKKKKKVLDGAKAFELYATYGLPLEITRDIAREQELDVDVDGFHRAMEEHRLASGAGKAMGLMGGEDAEFYNSLRKDLQAKGKLGKGGAAYDPYGVLEVEGELLALVANGQAIDEAQAGDSVEVLLPSTPFYVESGGQVSDTGLIQDAGNKWEIEVSEMRKPAAGMVIHIGEVVRGQPRVGDRAVASVDTARRHDIRRNHTATHLLHAALHQVLGESARQAGSLVAPDRFRFDFNHPEAMTPEQIELVERIVNAAVAADYPVRPVEKSRQQAVAEGAMALFGEKYGETVRTITIGDPERRYSYELCGGTHLDRTSDVGAFIILNEGSAAAGIRRIEAVTGRGAYELIARRFKALKQAAGLLSSTPEAIPEKVESLQGELSAAKKEIAGLRQEGAVASFTARLADVPMIRGVPVLTLQIPNADADTLRQLADRFRQKYTSGTAVLGSVIDGRPTVIASVTEDLVKRGLNAGELVKFVAAPLGGSGGGKPTLAQAGGKDASKLEEALASVPKWVEKKLK
jgi:alanyl-tRNA synthetase